MSVIFILVIASLVIALGFLAAFIWSVKNGQYDDDYTPSVRILFEDKQITQTNETNQQQKPSDYGNSKISVRQ